MLLFGMKPVVLYIMKGLFHIPFAFAFGACDEVYVNFCDIGISRSEASGTKRYRTEILSIHPTISFITAPFQRTGHTTESVFRFFHVGHHIAF